MIIDLRNKYVFVHIPKCAGESMRSALSRFGGVNFLTKHAPATEALKELGSDYWDLFSFSIVRNPWDQVVSFYEHLRKPLYMDHGDLRKQYEEFDGVLNPRRAGKLACEVDFSSWCTAIYRDGYDNDTQLSDLTYFTHDSEGVQIVEFVGRYETIYSDIECIFRKINVYRQLPMKNSSRRVDYRMYFDSATKNVIGDAFSKTIEAFDYDF